MRAWLYPMIRDYYFDKWLSTKDQRFLDKYHEWADKARPFLPRIVPDAKTGSLWRQ
jgi:hypothetical protein